MGNEAIQMRYGLKERGEHRIHRISRWCGMRKGGRASRKNGGKSVRMYNESCTKSHGEGEDMQNGMWIEYNRVFAQI
jgi:hypothetical protein